MPAACQSACLPTHPSYPNRADFPVLTPRARGAHHTATAFSLDRLSSGAVRLFAVEGGGLSGAAGTMRHSSADAAVMEGGASPMGGSIFRHSNRDAVTAADG